MRLLKVVQSGGLLIVKVRLLSSASVASGVKTYSSLWNTEGAGSPEICGRLLNSVTVMLKAGRLAVSTPSLTLITMSVFVPISRLDGVPDKAPLSSSKLAQEGRLTILNTSASSLASMACGTKL